MSSRTFAPLLAAILLLAGPAEAQLTIEIIGGGANQIPIAVLPFAGESVLSQGITEIIEQDLSRSGRFRAIFVGGVSPLPTEIAQVNFPEWKSRLADAIVIGQAQRLADGKLEVRFRLLARRHANGLCLVSEQEADPVRAEPIGEQAARAGRELQGLEQRPGLVAGRQAARRRAHQGRDLPDLPDERRWNLPPAPHGFPSHRYGTIFHPGWSIHL